MQIFSPLFARGRGTAKFIEALINGEPVAWTILGIVCAGLAIYVSYQVYKSKAENPASGLDEAPKAAEAEQQVCPRCGMRVTPMADGKCPACWEHKF